MVIEFGHFFNFFFSYSHFQPFWPLGGTFGGSYGPLRPPFMAYCVVPVPIWSWVPRCAILCNPCAKKKCSFMIIVLCVAFFALKSRFLRFLTPPPEAQSTPMVPIWTDTP